MILNINPELIKKLKVTEADRTIIKDYIRDMHVCGNATDALLRKITMMEEPERKLGVVEFAIFQVNKLNEYKSKIDERIRKYQAVIDDAITKSQSVSVGQDNSPSK